jgi:hypothetical protein
MGAGAPGPGDGGLGPPDGGASDGGSGGLGGGSPPVRLDAGVRADLCAPPDAGPGDTAQAEPGLSTSCEGLATGVAGTPSAVDFSLGTMGADCVSATSDGKGRVAFLMRGSAPSSFQPMAWLGAADGGLVLEPTAATAAPQPSGFAFAGAHLDLKYGRRDVFFYFSSSDDRPLLLDDYEPPTVAGAPGGGALVAFSTWNLERRFVSAVRFDPSGQQRSPPLDLVDGPRQRGRPLIAAAVSLGGNGLVAFSGDLLGDPSSIYGVWVGSDGSSDRRPLRLGPAASGDLLLRPLADGSIAVRSGNEWVARARPSGRVESPPPWLAQLASHDVLLRSSGKGYVVPSPGAVDPLAACAPLLQLRAPAGNLCATVGMQRAATRVDLGLDGTLFASFHGPPCEFGNCCHVRWWAGALP